VREDLLGMRDRRVEKRKWAISACLGMTHVIFQSLVLLFILLSCCQHLCDSIIRAQTIVSRMVATQSSDRELRTVAMHVALPPRKPKSSNTNETPFLQWEPLQTHLPLLHNAASMNPNLAHKIITAVVLPYIIDINVDWRFLGSVK